MITPRPRQERRDDEPGLAKDHRKQDRVDPHVIGREELDEVLVEVENQVNKPRNQGWGSCINRQGPAEHIRARPGRDGLWKLMFLKVRTQP